MKLKKLFGIVGIILLALLLIVGGYFAYVFLSWNRLPDNLSLDVTQLVNGTQAAADEEGMRTDTPYRIVSWNIGFGAYEDDYGFFMDGGTQSWAWSRERLDTNLRAIAKELFSHDADIVLAQEVDIDGTRSYHVDERVYLSSEAYPGLISWQSFAQNYDSPFLFYPITQPHGANKAGLMTFSRFPISSALRRSLPIEDTVMKLVDLDRCYSVNRIPVQDGGELVVYHLHLSAYTSDGTIATEQLRMLLEDMQREYDKGNWCIAGGDFNKDLLGDSVAIFGTDEEYSWAKAIPPETFDGVDMVLVGPLDEENPVPSCRNADGPYYEGQYVLTVDGFLVSPNVQVDEARVIDTAFRYSDHNPVEMDFTLATN